MTHVVTASAPGKLVLSGDYAVLEGAPALAAAVDMRAVVKIDVMNGLQHQLRVENTGQNYTFEGGFGTPVVWRSDAGANGKMLTAALDAFRAAGLSDAAVPPLRISTCTRSFYSQGKKLGIGSSAAVAVALTGALAVVTRSKIDMGMALRIHSDFQRSAGSGIDVVSSWQGGVVSMRRATPPSVAAVGWPEGLQVRSVWTGVPASTPAMLQRLADFEGRAPDSYRSCSARLCESAEQVAENWTKADTDTILASLSDYALALRELDAAAQIGIWSQPHERLAEIAAQQGVAYKPSGAGGGDYGLAFAADAELLNSFMEVVAESGFGAATPAWSETGLQTQPLNL